VAIEKEEREMAYSVMVWLVDPGEYPQEEDEMARAVAGREHAAGAATGVNIGPALPRMVYGVYENQQDAERALGEISGNLQQNMPLRMDMHGGRVFLIPAQRVHYVVCDEVQRPVDLR
jgi:hypothetical protein